MWAHGDDVYLGTRTTLFAFKVSLHKSGIWRVAFVAELEQADSEADRAVFKWQRPGEYAPGWTPSIGILVSPLEAERPLKKAKVDDQRIQWHPPAVHGSKLLFKVLFSDPSYSEDDLRSVTDARDRLAGRLVKRDGEIVWLVLREDDFGPAEDATIRDVMAKIKIHLAPGSSEDAVTDDTRALLVAADDVPGIRNQPTIFDIALGKENLDIPSS
jgi:hypothetical protein